LLDFNACFKGLFKRGVAFFQGIRIFFLGVKKSRKKRFSLLIKDKLKGNLKGKLRLAAIFGCN